MPGNEDWWYYKIDMLDYDVQIIIMRYRKVVRAIPVGFGGFAVHNICNGIGTDE